MSPESDDFASSIPNPSPQMQVVIAFFRGIMNQDAAAVIDQLSEDHHHEWVVISMDQIAPKIQNREQARTHFEAMLGNNMFRDFKVRRSLSKLHNRCVDGVNSTRSRIT
jgi:hypothetical protein